MVRVKKVRIKEKKGENSKNGKGKSKGKFVCWFCGKEDHWASECPTLKDFRNWKTTQGKGSKNKDGQDKVKSTTIRKL